MKAGQKCLSAILQSARTTGNTAQVMSIDAIQLVPERLVCVYAYVNKALPGKRFTAYAETRAHAAR